jgi:hypothetical protein
MRAFKPSVTQPLQAVQCRAPVKNGDDPGRRWKKKAILGGLVCRSHGGQLPSVREAAARTVEEARLRLLLATDDAVAVLEYLISEGLSEPVRLRAAVEWRSWTGRVSAVVSRSGRCRRKSQPPPCWNSA